MKSIFSCIPIFLLCSFLDYQMAAAGTIAPSASAGRNMFAAKLFQEIAVDKTQENIIFSPASIQSCVALAYFGAEGKTAEEMRVGLHLGGGDKQALAETFGEFLKSAFKSDSNGPQLNMANRIYVNDALTVAPKFNEIAKTYFDSQPEQVNFADSATAVQKINSWVEEQTQNKIKNLLQENSVDADTSLVLVNAIYFKGKWATPFSASTTHKANFAVNANQKVSVDMMYMDEDFKYADLPELDAKALEMPYQNSDISMLIILPNTVDGLQQLESKLASLDLNDITSKMSMEDVNVFLPKFRIEFDVDLKTPLKKLGMSTMFSDSADFSGLLTTKTPQKVSEVRHKAFLDVNEAGSEAAAATYMKIVPMSLNLRQKTFKANHPFVFAIRTTNAVYFAGHVAKF